MGRGPLANDEEQMREFWRRWQQQMGSTVRPGQVRDEHDRIQGAAVAIVNRAEIEDFLYTEATLLDTWSLDDWLELFDPTPNTRSPATTRQT